MIRLTDQEAFWISEQRAGRTIPETAGRWALSLWKVKQIFAGLADPPVTPSISALDLDDREMVLILMRRNNIEQADLATLLGVSRVTVNRRLQGHEDISDTLPVLLAFLDIAENLTPGAPAI